MPKSGTQQSPTDARARLGAKVRELRRSRHWSQAQLARELGLSQPRLSQIESGVGVLSADALLRILRLFNVGVDYFDVQLERASPIQNALARHGASHLLESRDALLPSHLDEPIEVVWEVLRHPESTRHLTALAPVLVASSDRIALRELASRLARIGREHRLGWLLETLRQALAEGERGTSSERRAARRADVAAGVLLDSGTIRLPSLGEAPDVLDPDIRTAKSAEQAVAQASPEARRWGIATRLQTSDFAAALRAARESR